MGYEVAGAVGVKMAQPEDEVYVFAGDSTFQMLHSEIMTAIADAGKQSRSTLIDMEVIPKTMSDGYDSWWNVRVV